MHLDLATILILHPLSLLIGAVCFLYLRWRSRSSRGLGNMALGFLVLGGGSLLAGAGLQGIVDYPTWTFFSFVSGPFAYALFSIGLLKLVTEREAGHSLWIYALPLVLTVAAVVTQFHLVDVVRSTVFLAVMGCTALSNAWLVVRDPQGEKLESRFALAGALFCKALIAVVTIWSTLFPEVGGRWPAATFLVLILDQFAIAMCVLIVVQERAENRLIALAETDSLTGIRNRHWLMDRLPREAAAGGAFVVIDIDHFKSVNDQFGHWAGDEVLVAVAQAMAGRLEDTMLFARLGGEEFGLFLPSTTEAGVMDCAEMLRRRVEALAIVYEGRVIPVTVSAGVAVAHEAMPMTQLLARADDMLYAAKRAGRNRVFLFRCRCAEKMSTQLQLELQPQVPATD